MRHLRKDVLAACAIGAAVGGIAYLLERNHRRLEMERREERLRQLHGDDALFDTPYDMFRNMPRAFVDEVRGREMERLREYPPHIYSADDGMAGSGILAQRAAPPSGIEFQRGF